MYTIASFVLKLVDMKRRPLNLVSSKETNHSDLRHDSIKVQHVLGVFYAILYLVQKNA